MKKKMLVSAALFVGAFFLCSCGHKDGNTVKSDMDSSMSHMAQNDSMNSSKMQMDDGMMKSMSGTMGKMNDLKMTGDFDLDFAKTMTLHHQAAIDMSRVEIAKGEDEQIKTIAKNIIAAQSAEIGELQTFIEKHKKQKGKASEMHDELTETMKSMIGTMNKTKVKGNTDMNFVMMMIPHHESAVTMAKDELTYGMQPGLKKMAEKMIADQSKEIGELKTWSSNQK